MWSENNQKHDWQHALSDLITDPRELLAELELDMGYLPAAQEAAKLFPLRVTRGFAARMRKGSLDDPLLRQVLPIGEEMVKQLGFGQDPLLEAQFNPVPGLLHKYPGRVLVMLTSACAVHCRYCFRRDFPYDENNPGRRGWEQIFSYIQADAGIHEVILSGGDPLAVSDNLLRAFGDELVKISHVRRLRIHSRMPVVLPERITEEFIHWITGTRLDPVIVIHSNHAQELDASVARALKALREAGIVVLNQTVLLKGINDDIQTLAQLSEALFTMGVLPYYLHVLDKVRGTAHFDLSLARAKEIHAGLLRCLPGYLVPRLVWEKPNELSKTWLAL